MGTTTRYNYDGVNELVEDNGSGTRQRYYVHGVSYVDERLMMYRDSNSRPYYYVVDRMYNVRMLIDRAGAIVERYCYNGYGQPLIRESCGRGDMNQDTLMTSTDDTRFTNAKTGTIWDPRADVDDDGDVDSADQTLYDAKKSSWAGLCMESPPTVAQAFSDVDNPFMFQGVPHFALDTGAADTAGKLMLNHHRARFAQPPEGRWPSRDPLHYLRARRKVLWGKERDDEGQYGRADTHSFEGLAAQASLYSFMLGDPIGNADATGLSVGICVNCSSAAVNIRPEYPPPPLQALPSGCSSAPCDAYSVPGICGPGQVFKVTDGCTATLWGGPSAGWAINVSCISIIHKLVFLCRGGCVPQWW